VLAIVLEAVVRIGRRALRNGAMVAIAAAAFVAIFAFDVPFPLIILAAGLTGLFGALAGVAVFLGGGHGRIGEAAFADADSALGEATPEHARPTLAWSLKLAAVCLLLWLGPVLILLLALGSADVFSQIAVFFSKMAVVTFGGAYAVLAYVAQQAVETYGWLRPGEMLDGLGLAETTPGPLIMVVQFVGFMGGYRNPGALDPMLAGTLAGMLTTWVTFVPCFLWIFLGAPFVEALRGNRALGGALAAITAAVVGVILNLAIWFALHVLFAEVNEIRAPGFTLDVPEPGSLRLVPLLLTAGALVAVFRLNLGMIVTLAACAGLGVGYYLLGGST
jgi:chromate transporter